MDDKKRSPLDSLRDKVYERKEPASQSGDRDYLHPNELSAPRAWDKIMRPKKKTSKTPFVMKIFWFSIAFFVLSAIIALIVFIGGSNIVSSRNVEIRVSGPSTIEAGSETVLQIIIDNKNDTDLEFTDLIVTFPDGTRSPDALGEELGRKRISLETIPAGREKTQPLTVVFFGQEDSTKILNLELEYRVAGSNAIFVAEESHEIVITSSPIDLVASSLKETSSGQEFTLTMTVRSNGEEVIEDLLVSVEYPFGYVFADASPNASFDNSIWDIGDLPSGAERTIEIKGVLNGQDGEEKVFRIESGSRSTSDVHKIGVVYNSWLLPISIARPFLGLDLRINGKTLDSYAVVSNEKVRGEIVWTNNTPVKITDATITAKLTGDVLDKSSVEVTEGIFRSIDNTIIWTGETKEALSEIEPGEQGVLAFTFTPHSLFATGNSIIKSPTIEIDIGGEGERLGEEGVSGVVESSVTKDIRIISDVSFSGRSLYFAGPFANQGPIPPRADKETTYTITWSVVNSSNTLSGAEVEATLPEQVVWTGVATPSDEDFSYDGRTRSVVWDLGVVQAGSGITAPPREISFQVSLTPSVTNVGSAMELIKEATFTASDDFADRVIRRVLSPLTTELFNDPQYIHGQGRVAE